MELLDDALLHAWLGHLLACSGQQQHRLKLTVSPKDKSKI